MGRIDEALRRAGAAAAGGAAPRAAVVRPEADDPFTSPWETDEHTSLHAAPASLEAPVPPVARRAAENRPHAAVVARRPVDVSADDECRRRLAAAEATDPLLVEQFRRLAATLIQTQRTATLKVVMIASAAPEEGKTLTALNLALVLSESFRRRVLLIDADLRRPKLTELANITVDGLGDVVKAIEPRKAPLVPVTDTLTLLPAGRPDPDPMSGLTSPKMQQLLQEAGATFDWVIVDTPPIGAAPDATLLCAMADAAVLVVRAEQTAVDAVQQAIDAIGRDRIIGVVLNGVDRHTVPSYGDYYLTHPGGHGSR
jgi:protein-tyrosine kinase